MAQRPAIFLDKDGTLIEDIPFNADLAKLRLTPHAATGLAVFSALGFVLIVVSNQSGIALNRLTASQVLQGFDHIQQLLKKTSCRSGLALDGFYFCPHKANGGNAMPALACACRKPAPGLLLQAAREHGVQLSASWMIGDILDDIEAGHRAGCRTVLIANGNETEWRPGPLRTPDGVADHLLDAALLIARETRSTRTSATGAARFR